MISSNLYIIVFDLFGSSLVRNRETRLEHVGRICFSRLMGAPTGEEDLSESACNAMLSSLFAPARAVP